MGVKGIRTALKVDLEKPAWEQQGLHVCGHMHLYELIYAMLTAIEPMASRW